MEIDFCGSKSYKPHDLMDFCGNFVPAWKMPCRKPLFVQKLLLSFGQIHAQAFSPLRQQFPNGCCDFSAV